MRRSWFQIQHGSVLSNCQQTLPRRWRLLYVLFNNDKILLPALQMGFVQQMFSARREWRYSPLETWKEQCLLWTLLETSRRKQQRETKTKPHTRKICFPSHVSNYFTLICSYFKLTSQVCCQSVDTSYGLSSSHEQCRFFLLFFFCLQFTISLLAIFLCLPKNGKICGKNCYGMIGER